MNPKPEIHGETKCFQIVPPGVGLWFLSKLFLSRMGAVSNNILAVVVLAYSATANWVRRHTGTRWLQNIPGLGMLVMATRRKN